MQVVFMYESISSVGERGQITLPKALRVVKGIKPKDKVIVKLEGGKIVVEKSLSKKEKEKLMVEGYKKMAKLDKEIAEEMRHVSKEAGAVLDDY